MGGVGISDQKIVGDVTQAGYSFHHAARTHRTGGGDNLKFEKHSRFQAWPFENYHLTFICWGVSIRVAIISEFVYSLATSC